MGIISSFPQNTGVKGIIYPWEAEQHPIMQDNFAYDVFLCEPAENSIYLGGAYRTYKLDKELNILWQRHDSMSLHRVTDIRVVPNENYIYTIHNDQAKMIKKVDKDTGNVLDYWDLSSGDFTVSDINRMFRVGDILFCIDSSSKKINKIDLISKSLIETISTEDIIFAFTIDSSSNIITANSASSFSDGDITKRDEDGAVLWQKEDALSRFEKFAFLTDSNEDVVYSDRSGSGANTNYYIKKRDGNTGALIWSYTLDSNVQYMTIDSNDNVYFCTASKKMMKLDTDGSLVYQTPASDVLRVLKVYNNVIYCSMYSPPTIFFATYCANTGVPLKYWEAV